MGCRVQATFVFGNLVIATLELLDHDWDHISMFSLVARSRPDAGPKPDARLYGPECGLSSGPALGVSTFPWGRVMDTREKESLLIILRLEGRGRISYPGLGVWNI
ncbi:hypothetical protein CRG98_038905 [Punica granatum]|uniref:Uncharacterized protein n=1 Tax=Punica granatum TaxID=22663 RepID=A0A2I0I9M9_PUNGR|nr:hypothetical protein CRG98_038905 [Punica granatum]